MRDCEDVSMKKFIYVMIITIVVLAGCKIEYNSPQSARDDNYGVGYSSTMESAESGAVKKSGSGDQVFTNLDLKKGSSVLNIKLINNTQIVIRILDNAGALVTKISKSKSNYTGKQVIQIPKDGDNYMIEIQSDGDWEIELSSTVSK